MFTLETIDHKADVQIKIIGDAQEDIFIGALSAIEKISSPVFSKEKVFQKIKIKSFDSAHLLIDFLNEIIFLGQTNKETYASFEITSLKNNYLEGKLNGFKVERFNADIKAATYHNLKFFQREDNKWEAEIVFDI